MRDRPIQGLVYACRESNYKWFASDTDNPYTTPKEKPFHWIRMRVLGRTLTLLGPPELPHRRHRLQSRQP